MFEKATAKVLSKALSAYFVGIDQSVTKTSIWSGHLVLNNLDIHPDIGQGSVEEIIAQIPWRSPGNSEFTIKKMRLRLNPLQARERDKIIESKMSHIDKLVMFMSTSQSYFTKLVKGVLDNLLCHISDVEISYGPYKMCFHAVTLKGSFTDKSLHMKGFDLFWDKDGEMMSIIRTNLHVAMTTTEEGSTEMSCRVDDPINVNGSIALYQSAQATLQALREVLVEEDRLLKDSGVDFSNDSMKKLGAEYISLYSQKLMGKQVWDTRLSALACWCPPRLVAKWRIEAEKQCNKSSVNIFQFYEFNEVADLPEFDISTFSVAFTLQSALFSLKELGLSLTSKMAHVRAVIADDWTFEGNLKSIEVFRANTRIISLVGTVEDEDLGFDPKDFEETPASEHNDAFEVSIAKKQMEVLISGSLHPMNFYISPPLVGELMSLLRAHTKNGTSTHTALPARHDVLPDKTDDGKRNAGPAPVMFDVTDYAPSVHVDTATVKNISIDLTVAGPWLHVSEHSNVRGTRDDEAFILTAGHLRAVAPMQPLNDFHITIDITQFGMRGPEKEIIPMLPLQLAIRHKFEKQVGDEKICQHQYITVDAKSQGRAGATLTPASYLRLHRLGTALMAPFRGTRERDGLTARSNSLLQAVPEWWHHTGDSDDDEDDAIQTSPRSTATPDASLPLSKKKNKKDTELHLTVLAAVEDVQLSLGDIHLSGALSFHYSNEEFKAQLNRAVLRDVFSCETVSVTLSQADKLVSVKSSPLDFTLEPSALARLLDTLGEIELESFRARSRIKAWKTAVDVPKALTMAFAIDSITMTCLSARLDTVVHVAAARISGSARRGSEENAPAIVDITLPEVRTSLPCGRVLFAPKSLDAPLLAVHAVDRPPELRIDWAQACIFVEPDIYRRLAAYVTGTMQQLTAAWARNFNSKLSTDANTAVTRPAVESCPSPLDDNAAHEDSSEDRPSWLRLNFGVPLLLIPTAAAGTVCEREDIEPLHGEELMSRGLTRYWRVDLGLMNITLTTFTLEGMTIDSVACPANGGAPQVHSLVPTCGRCSGQWTPQSVQFSTDPRERPVVHINAHREHVSEFFAILSSLDNSSVSTPDATTTVPFAFFAIVDVTMNLGFTAATPLAHIGLRDLSVESKHKHPLTISCTHATIDDRRVNGPMHRLVEAVDGLELQMFAEGIWKVCVNEPWVRVFPQLTLDLAAIATSAITVDGDATLSGTCAPSDQSVKPDAGGLQFVDFQVCKGKLCLEVPGRDDFIALNMDCNVDIQFKKREAEMTYVDVDCDMKVGLVRVQDERDTPLGVGTVSLLTHASVKYSPMTLVCMVDKFSLTSMQIRVSPKDIGLLATGIKHSVAKDLPTCEPLEEIMRRIPLEAMRTGRTIEMTVAAHVPGAEICIVDDRVVCPFVRLQLGFPLVTFAAYVKNGSALENLSLLAEQARADVQLANRDNGLWEPFVRPLEASIQVTFDRHSNRASINMEDRFEVLYTDTARSHLLGDFIQYALKEFKTPTKSRMQCANGDVIVYNLTTEAMEMSIPGDAPCVPTCMIAPGKYDSVWGRQKRVHIAGSHRAQSAVVNLRSDVFQSLRPGKDDGTPTSHASPAVARRRSSELRVNAFVTHGSMYDGAIVFPQPSQKVIILSPALRLLNETDIPITLSFKGCATEAHQALGIVCRAELLHGVLTDIDCGNIEVSRVVPPACAFLAPRDAMKALWSINGCDYFDPLRCPDMFGLSNGRKLKLTTRRGPHHFLTLVVEAPLVLQSAVPALIEVLVSVTVPWLALPDSDTQVETVVTMSESALALDAAQKECKRKGYSGFVHDAERRVYEFKGGTRCDAQSRVIPGKGKKLYLMGTQKERLFTVKARQALYVYDADFLYTPQMAVRFAAVNRQKNWSARTTLAQDYGTQDIPFLLDTDDQRIFVRVAKKRNRWTFLVENWFVNATGIARVHVLGRNLTPLPDFGDEVSFMHIDENDGEAVINLAINKEIHSAILPVLNKHTKLKKHGTNTVTAVLISDTVDSSSTFDYVYSTVWTLCPPLMVHNDLLIPILFEKRCIDPKAASCFSFLLDTFVLHLGADARGGQTPALPMKVKPACYSLAISGKNKTMTLVSVEVCEKRGVTHVSIRPPINRLLVNYCRYVHASIIAQDCVYECPFGDRVPFGVQNPFQNARYFLVLTWIKPIERVIKAEIDVESKWTRFFHLPTDTRESLAHKDVKGFGVVVRCTMLPNGRKGKILINPQITENAIRPSINLDVSMSDVFVRLVSVSQREVAILSIKDSHFKVNRKIDRTDVSLSTQRVQVDYYQAGNLPSCVLLYAPHSTLSLYSTTTSTIDGGKVEFGELQLGIDFSVFEEIGKCLKPSCCRGLTMDCVMARAGVPYHLSILPKPPRIPMGFAVRSLVIQPVNAKAYAYFNLKEQEVFHPNLRALMKVSNFGRQVVNVDGANLKIPAVRINYRGSVESLFIHVHSLYNEHVSACWKTLFANSNAILGGVFGRHFWDKRKQIVTQRRRSLLRVTSDGVIR